MCRIVLYKKVNSNIYMFSVSPSLSKRHRVIVYMFYGKGPGRRTPFLCLLLFKRCIFVSG